ncbi:NAD-dependent aldehyde dehydrogenase [Frankia canadensis]|uniref:NAD-dependent aldehyde dehydrogenase n=1 Tax=Frankia canadensis TaxID=1836972 RepID=A0A2I2KM79_9ACTN|nr:aldehyde dehydrogenase family protein [Frankia canadensis]SNQ46777.1 NAD-dependent aldehyde dehydrogenase [Frankia canadensis]SOU54067.1 NAD-dependent aldehyde dehydrogenase [Frankia canadensis]
MQVDGGVQIDALGPAGPYRARARQPLAALSGAAIGEISQVPALYVRRTLAAMRAAPVVPGAVRFDALDRAAELFLTATLGGFAPDEYVELVSTASGVPRGVVRQSVEWIADVLRSQRHTVELARPHGAVADWRHEKTLTGSAVWARRGDLFAVHAAGNTPAVHGLWPEALALGYKVVVRPSSREPYTAFRLVEALRTAGFPPATITLLPTDHTVADILIEESDFAIVYGGQDVVDKYAAIPTVLAQGPGRSKILITADVDWREHIDVIAGSVSHLGGTACTCATAVLVEGDPEPLAAALADRLGRIPSLPPDHPDAILTVAPTASVVAIDRYLHQVAGDARALLGGDGIVDVLPTGGAVLRPAVHLVDSPTAPQLGVELPFPCVWVGPWRPEDGIAPLRDSLVLTAMTGRAELIDALLDEPSIINLYLGDNPTTWLRPGIPHDGYLSERLMRTKGMIRSAVA